MEDSINKGTNSHHVLKHYLKVFFPLKVGNAPILSSVVKPDLKVTDRISILKAELKKFFKNTNIL